MKVRLTRQVNHGQQNQGTRFPRADLLHSRPKNRLSYMEYGFQRMAS